MGSIITVAGYILAFMCNGKKSLIMLYLSTKYSQSIFESISRFSEAHGHVIDCMKRVANVFELENVPQEKVYVNSNDTKTKANFTKGKLCFKKVNLKYRPERELVLKDLDFVVEAGLKVGIVGRTGAGKSTISNALTRIVELDSGSI